MRQRLLKFLRERAPDTVDVSILQPADLFLDAGGEDLRRRIYMSQSGDGTDLCLRPEFTIPICKSHIGQSTDVSARYAYGGVVFRQSREGTNEFDQVGLEDLGNANALASDVDCLSDMVATLERCGRLNYDIVMGDQDLFQVVVSNLKLPNALAHRLVRSFGSSEQIRTLIEELVNGNNVGGKPSTKADQWAEERNLPELVAHIEGLMSDSGLSHLSGRSPTAIAQRMIEKSALAHFRLDQQQAELLNQFLNIEAPLSQSASLLNKFSHEWGLEFGEVLENFGSRNQMIAQQMEHGPDITFRASFGRKLDYYTGILFEAFAHETDVSVAGGGRYDGLCTLLGSASPVEAVGFSVSVDRVREVMGQ